MARGRMVTNLISKDKDVNNLANDTCRLLFTWLVTFADREGRTYGDASIVRATVFPRRADITTEDIESYLQELNKVGLILRYTTNDEQYILFPAFEKNQIGMRKDREPESEIPKPSDADLTAYCRKFAGKKPEVCRILVGLIEWNGMEEEGEGKPPPGGDNDIPETSYKPLEVAFCKATGQHPKIGGGQPTQKWVAAFLDMKKAGATPDDIEQACLEMVEKNYTIANPSSIVNWVTGIVTKRNIKKSGKTSDAMGFVPTEYIT